MRASICVDIFSMRYIYVKICRFGPRISTNERDPWWKVIVVLIQASVPTTSRGPITILSDKNVNLGSFVARPGHRNWGAASTSGSEFEWRSDFSDVIHPKYCVNSLLGIRRSVIPSPM
jgi:hypothetical protein